MEVKIIQNARLVTDLLRSPAFETVSLSETYRHIARRTGINFDATIKLLEHFPFFVAGAQHCKLREFMAKHVTGSLALQIQSAKRELARIFDTRFSAPDEV